MFQLFRRRDLFPKKSDFKTEEVLIDKLAHVRGLNFAEMNRKFLISKT